MKIEDLIYKVRDKETNEVFELDEIDFEEKYCLKKGESRENLTWNRGKLFDKYELIPPVVFNKVIVGTDEGYNRAYSLKCIGYNDNTVVLRWGSLPFWTKSERVVELIEPRVPVMKKLDNSTQDKIRDILKELGYKNFNVNGGGFEIKRKTNLSAKHLQKISNILGAKITPIPLRTRKSFGWYFEVVMNRYKRVAPFNELKVVEE